MHWADLERRQPRLASRARTRLLDPGLLLLVTTGPDGTPRETPAEPLLRDGKLLLSTQWLTLEACELPPGRPILVRGVVTDLEGAEGEVTVGATARAETDVDAQHAYAAALGDRLGWHPEIGRFHLVEVEIETVSSVRYRDGGDRLVASWPPALEYVRRATSVPGVTERLPLVDLLDPE